MIPSVLNSWHFVKRSMSGIDSFPDSLQIVYICLIVVSWSSVISYYKSEFRSGLKERLRRSYWLGFNILALENEFCFTKDCLVNDCRPTDCLIDSLLNMLSLPYTTKSFNIATIPAKVTFWFYFSIKISYN